MIQHSKCVYGYGDEESAILVIIILIIMKNSGLNAEEKISSTEGFYQESRPISYSHSHLDRWKYSKDISISKPF
jgi:hypothetical protein